MTTISVINQDSNKAFPMAMPDFITFLANMAIVKQTP